MLQKNYEVEVLVNGHPVREYLKDSKFFIEGKEGTEYSIRIKNNGYKRILAIPTVDGLSVIDGKEGSYNSRGYIINGYSSLTIEGWRISTSELAKFYFSDPRESYGERVGKPGNLGVIGVAIFREKEQLVQYTYYKYDYDKAPTGQYPYNPWTTSSYLSKVTLTNSSYYCSASNQVNKVSEVERGGQGVGTGWGNTKKSEVVNAEFERESSPDSIFQVFYNTKKQLEKIGVILSDEPKYVTPSAFPNEFCAPPKR